MLDFLLVHIDRHISPLEMLESAGMIKVKMAHDDGFHIFDVMAGLLDLRLELVVFGVINAGEDVVQWRAPDFRVVFSSTGLEEDQAFGRVLNQDGDDDQFPAGATCVGVACCGSAAATDEPSFLEDGLGCWSASSFAGTSHLLQGYRSGAAVMYMLALCKTTLMSFLSGRM